ncbi:MAG: hypothetical protein ACPGVU_13580 [Limisphaerales bacterium]
MRKLNIAVCFAFASLVAGCQTNRPVVFTAMGCGPYNPEAEKALSRFIALDNRAATSAFMIHCGDIVTGKNTNWPESQYVKVADILIEGNQIPTFIVPGDNEWNDQDDPAAGWSKWEKHFMMFDAKWVAPAKVVRQTGRMENFAFVLDGVLFIGINKVGGKVHDADEWQRRLKDNGAWVKEQMEKHGDHVHSAAIFAQAKASGNKVPGNSSVFVDSLKNSAKAFGKPILYLHADGHKWYVIEGDWAPNITHVQMDLISAKFPPLQVTATGDPKEPFRFDRRLSSKEWGTK